MQQTKTEYIHPGYFSESAAADARRKEFDIKNHSLIHTQQKPDFIFAGDSITQFWELNAYFNRPGQLIINRGIAGDTTTWLCKRFYADVLQLNPRYCILGIGINDSLDLDGDYWKRIPPSPYGEVIEKAKNNILDIIRQAASTDTPLILTSLLPFDIPVSLYEPVREEFVRDMNCWLMQTAQQESLIYVDYYSAIVNPDTGKILAGTTYDGLHPDAVGYGIMSEVLKSTLIKNNIYI